ncbi:multicomponent Na+:H+ antiporter subunit A [Salinibacillus kushneri]|uniref:Multicomponent Na+:H+ antiporter subunit A n=1 Tax=Salinibacillus kushneri TaxID=237682 RepID=A0A1I0G4T4_9BACI|nr:Na+/H+ antiporter subunit A [Salinibacillus kushneri]SET65658.1 multicomponent Na+:H+ antiporter subunit A [Salinibacillus kushneri]
MIYAVFAPLVVTLLIPLISKWKEKIHTGWFLLPIPFLIFLYFIQFAGENFTPKSEVYPWIPSLDISIDFYLDGLSLLFVLLISGIGTLVVLYSIYYLHKSEQLKQFYIYLFLFMFSMLGVVLSDNVFVLYTFWEFTSLSSFLLIGFWHHREGSRYGALKSMLITVFGGLSLLAGFIMLTVISGTTSIQSMIEQTDVIVDHPYFPLLFVFLVLGAFTKSAQFPFHIWLPDAMEAPTPVSAYLHSATMVKAGIFLIARFSPLLGQEPIFFAVISVVGLITLFWASFMAVRQTDLKGILAFSTVSQLGMIMAMLGFGTEAAIFAAVFHILNHATFKGSLFMIAGIVDHETGTRDIRKLGGLMTFMPMSATLAVFGVFSMAGAPLPFLNGFYSKEEFLGATVELNQYTGGFLGFLQEAIPYIAVIGSIFTFVYSMYFFFGTFRGPFKEKELDKKPHEAPVGMLISPTILVLGVILIGLFPNAVNEPFLAHSAEAVFGGDIHAHLKFWHGFETPFIMSLIIVGIGTILAVTRKKWAGVYNIFPRKGFNEVYNFVVDSIENGSKKITETYMTGSLRHYVAFILTAIFLICFSIMIISNGFAFDFSQTADITIPEILVGLVMAIAAIATIFTTSRLGAIITVGVVGYGLSILFVLYRAPDLALTQLIVETVSVALFLLCFKHLPELRKLPSHPGVKSTNSLIAICFGGLMTLIGISAHSTKLFSPISDYFLEQSVPLGGGHNVVNVILVDMRGLDTLFEITVLGIAALAIYGLIKLRHNKGAK